MNARVLNCEELLQFFPECQNLQVGQKEIITAVLEGHNLLVIMPAGSVKDWCYQFPAIILKKKLQKGMTIFISPSIAMMTHQVEQLRNKGLEVELLTNSISYESRKQILKKVADSQVTILFISPELLSDGLLLASLKQAGPIALCVVDEVNCLTEWSHKFRGDYLFITQFLQKLKYPQVMAYTVTAVSPVRDEIVASLEITKVFDTFPAFRDNLLLNVKPINSKLGRNTTISSILKNLSGPGIIYTSEKNKTKEIYEFLQSSGFKADYYHPGRSNSDKARVCSRFMSDEFDILCATKDITTRIDKKNIRFIIHYQIPESLEAYLHEIDLGGRDEKSCHCFLLYNLSDTGLYGRLITKKYPRPEDVRKAYLNIFGLDSIQCSERPERNIPIEQFREEKTSILLRCFENIGLVSRKGEIAGSIEVDLKAKNVTSEMKTLVEAIREQLAQGLFSRIRTRFLAQQINKSEVEALEKLYRALVEGIVDIGAREFRFIQYLKLRPDITKLDLNKIEEEMIETRNFKLKQLEQVTTYAENSTECRAKFINSALGKSLQTCGRCDICFD